MLLPSSFVSKKSHILSSLSVPAEEYDDLSPKGSIDAGIRDLIDNINAQEGFVTTSSCAGRISVFLEGKKATGSDADEESTDVKGVVTTAGIGGKGGGGRWLFVSHDPVVDEYDGFWAERLGVRNRPDEKALQDRITRETRLIHFKFEPMILHILTASLQHAQAILSAAMQAGFRESGALNLTSSTLESATPMVGVRSMGLAFESVIGYELDGMEVCFVPDWQLKNLVEISNQRFVENTKRIERFKSLIQQVSLEEKVKPRVGDGGEWEDKDARRERKRAEGLRRAEALRASAAPPADTSELSV